jgi:hypothetical protein
MPRPDKLKRQLKQLIAERRKQQLAMQPCPVCGMRPTDGMQAVDEGGIDTRTGEPGCEECSPRRGRIEFIMPNGKPDKWPDGPYWHREQDEGPDEAA